jgi:periplasmic divalent cation tolerance protein
MTDIIFVYITHPEPDAADALARGLVEKRLAACVNMLSGMRSVYRWQGKVEAAAEVVMIAKTRRDLFGALEAFVRARHPYECPCIVALGTVDGNAGYMDWIRQSADATA